MRFFVTGGAGFIGANFLNLYVPSFPEHQFINIDALTYAANLNSLDATQDYPNYQFKKVDLTQYDAVFAAIEEFDPDVIVHFAAESHVDRSINGPRVFVDSNIVGTFNLLEACRSNWQSKTGLFHHVSTDEVYGSLNEGGRFTEGSRYNPSSPYAASKAASDHLVRAYARTFEIRTRVTNCSNNYGPLQFPEKLIPLMILNALERQPLPVYGTGDNVRDWLFVNDHCHAIWTALEHGEDGATYNVGGCNQERNIDVVNTICRLVAEETGAPARELLDLITFVEDRPGHDLRYAIDTGRIERNLGWKPAETFETGLRKTVRWYLDNTEWVEQAKSGVVQSDQESGCGSRIP